MGDWNPLNKKGTLFAFFADKGAFFLWDNKGTVEVLS